MTNIRKEALLKFCSLFNISFNNLSLLDNAFFHRSVTNEGQLKNNERMEFLGDSVLGLICANYLYTEFPSFPEGELAKIKSVVVSEKSLSSIARDFKIDELLVLGHGEELSGGRNKDAILADCLEAVIGSYFLDSGYEKTSTFVLSFLAEKIKKTIQNKSGRDWKTLLQEYYQKESKQCPIYETVDIAGPDHNRTFKVIVKVGPHSFGPESGKSKKEAEQKVAETAYKFLTEN